VSAVERTAKTAQDEDTVSSPGNATSRKDTAARITPVAGGPLLVEGPVEIVLPDGTVRRSERPVVALCMCRRSLREPFCDTSHRHRMRPGRNRGNGRSNGIREDESSNTGEKNGSRGGRSDGVGRSDGGSHDGASNDSGRTNGNGNGTGDGDGDRTERS